MIYIKVKVKWSRCRPGVAQRVGRGIALLFHENGTRRGWVVSSTPRPHFTPGKDPVPILQDHMFYISSKNDWHPVTKTFTTLHYTCRHFISSHLNFTQIYFTSLHFTTLSFGLNVFKFPTATFHLTSTLHLTSFHCTATILSLHPVYKCFPNSLSKKFRFTSESP